MKNNKAITLIALIITIIVLLILTAVTINMVLGENGIISKAKIAVEKYKNEADKETVQLASYDNAMDALIDGINGSRNMSREEIEDLINQAVQLKVNEALSNYITNDNLENALSNYATTASLSNIGTKYALLWEGKATEKNTKYSFKDNVGDIENYDFIIIEFTQDNYYRDSTILHSSSLTKNRANDVIITTINARYASLHFVDKGFIIDAINGESAVCYNYPRKIWGIKF